MYRCSFLQGSFQIKRMEQVFTPDERKCIDKLLKKHRPLSEEGKTKEQKETIVMSQKGTKIIVKSEIAGPSPKPFKERTPKKLEEASTGNMN